MGTPPPPPDLRPLRIGEILDVAIKVYTRHAGTLFRLVLFIVAPVQLFGAIVLISTVPDASWLNPFAGFDPANQPTTVPETEDLYAFFAGNMLVLVLSVLASLLATAACFHAISSAYLGAPVDWRQSLRLAARKLHSLVWLSFISLIAITLGFIACIIPGIWLYVSFGVAVPALLTEDKRGFKAMSRSFELVQKRWWPTAAVMVLGFFIAGLVSSLVSGVLSLLLFTDLGDSIVASAAVSAIGNTIAGVIATPFQAAVIAIVYFDLRVRKEGFDLQLLAERIGIGPPTGPGLAPLGPAPFSYGPPSVGYPPPPPPPPSGPPPG